MALKAFAAGLAALLGLGAQAAAQSPVLRPIEQPQRLERAVLAQPAVRLAEPERLTLDSVRNELRRSEIFLAELDVAALSRAETPVLLQLGPTLELDMAAVARDVRRTSAERYGQITPRATGGAVRRRARSEESIFLLEDRLVVIRETRIDMRREACAGPPDAEAGLDTAEGVRARFCLPVAPRESWGALRTSGAFQIDEATGEARPMGSVSVADADAQIAEWRAELREMAPRREYVEGVSVAQARRASDEALFDMNLNSGERLIMETSVVPLSDQILVQHRIGPDAEIPMLRYARPMVDPDRLLAPDQARSLLDQLRDFTRAVGPRHQRQAPPPGFIDPDILRRGQEPEREGTRFINPNLQPPAPERDLQFNAPMRGPEASEDVLDARRFEDSLTWRGEVEHSDYYAYLLGRTVLRHFGEDYRVYLGRSGKWRIGFKWWAGYGYGIRFPFEVTARTVETFRGPDRDALNTDVLRVQLAARGVETMHDGSSPYDAAGLAEELQFGGISMFAAAYAGCRAYARLPVVKTIRVPCPSFSLPRNACGERGCDPDPRICNGTPLCSDYRPVIRRDPWGLASVEIPEQLTGLRLSAGVVSGWVRPGVAVGAQNTELRLDAHAIDGRFSLNGEEGCLNRPAQAHAVRLSADRCRITFRDEGALSSAPVHFEVLGDQADAQVRLQNPRLDFKMLIQPYMRIGISFHYVVGRSDLSGVIEVDPIRTNVHFSGHDGTITQRPVGDCRVDRGGRAACANATRTLGNTPY